MVASDKIEEAKDCFKTITQSGRNNYQKYDYFETKDIFPLVRKICKQFKLKTNIKPDLESNCFVLTITDQEDNSAEQFVVPYATLGATDAGKFMQDFGRCQTYAMRYLYIQAFEIAVPDDIDNRDQKKMQSKPQQKPKPKPQPKPKQVRTEPIEVTQEMVKDALDNIYDLLTDAGKEFNTASAIFQINRKYKDNPALVEACKKSLKTYTADKVDGGNG